VLASILPSQYQRSRAKLEPVTFKLGRILYEPQKIIPDVYFSIDCLISLLTAVDQRRTLEVGMVGNESMAGRHFIVGMGVSGPRALPHRESGCTRRFLKSAPSA
jgi:hypothetical protein